MEQSQMKRVDMESIKGSIKVNSSPTTGATWAIRIGIKPLMLDPFKKPRLITLGLKDVTPSYRPSNATAETLKDSPNLPSPQHVVSGALFSPISSKEAVPQCCDAPRMQYYGPS